MHVASLDDSQLELIFVSMGFWVVASMTSLEDDGEAKAVERPSFFESDGELIAMFLSLYEIFFFDVVLDGFVVLSAYKEFILPEIEDSIQHCKLCFFCFLKENSLLKNCISDGFCSVVK